MINAQAVAATPSCVALGPAVSISPASRPSTNSSSADARLLFEQSTASTLVTPADTATAPIRSIRNR